MHRILIVDDDKITHAFIKRSLLAEYDLASTFNGHQALEELQRSTPDIILLDVEMPGVITKSGVQPGLKKGGALC